MRVGVCGFNKTAMILCSDLYFEVCKLIGIMPEGSVNV